MPQRSRPPRGATPAGAAVVLTELSPVVLVVGAEPVLADRAVATVMRLARAQDPALEVTRIETAAYMAGQLALAASPSLFGEQRCILAAGVESATDAFIEDALEYVRAPAPDVTLVLRHAGGQRGKKLRDSVPAAGFAVLPCDPIKRDADKVEFVQAEFRDAGRRVETAAVRALVDALGSDLQELVAVCSQLVADTSGTVTEAAVRSYCSGRVEVSGFAVADAALAGNGAEAVRLLRHALSTGVDPVPLVAALAAKARTLAKVAATRGQGAAASRDLGLAPWQVDRARRELNGWTPEGLAAAITAVAAADAEVKGAARDPEYAVERAVLRVAAAHR